MAYSLISSVSAGSSGGNAVTTGSVDTSGANLLVLAVADYSANAASAITDSKSNTWTLINTYTVPSLTRLRLYYSKNPTVGTGHTFTATGTASYPSVAILACSDADVTGPFDKENGTATGGAASLATGSITPGQDAELVVTALGGSATQASLSCGTYTIQETITYSGSNHFGLSVGYQIQTTAAATNPNWSWTTSCEAAAGVASFKEAPFLPKQRPLSRAVMRAAIW